MSELLKRIVRTVSKQVFDHSPPPSSIWPANRKSRPKIVLVVTMMLCWAAQTTDSSNALMAQGNRVYTFCGNHPTYSLFTLSWDMRRYFKMKPLHTSP